MTLFSAIFKLPKENDTIFYPQLHYCGLIKEKMEEETMVQVKFYGFLREKFGAKKVEIDKANTISDIFIELKGRFGEERLKSVLSSIENLEIRKNIIVLKNGKNVLNVDEPVKREDEISIMPFLGGGILKPKKYVKK